MGASQLLRFTLLVRRDLTFVVLRRFTTKSDMVLGQALWRDPSLDVSSPTTENADIPVPKGASQSTLSKSLI
jgi:hypothetical protein